MGTVGAFVIPTKKCILRQINLNKKLNSIYKKQNYNKKDGSSSSNIRDE